MNEDNTFICQKAFVEVRPKFGRESHSEKFGILDLQYVFGGKIILRRKEVMTCDIRAVQMRTIIGGGNGGTNLGHLFQFAADQFSDAGALLSVQHM
ncbi:hypothetical protein LXL04_005359 [Taraxacum kok-saghyz]